jgi:hypothetical protein
MNTIVTIYWLRLGLGVTAAFICIGLLAVTGQITPLPSGYSPFLNSLSLAIIFYLASYYLVIKRRFLFKVEKPQKLFTTGIGIYFLTWLVSWILLYTIIVSV